MLHNSTQYDLAIVGGGPAAVAAGVYASRKRLKTILIAKDFGGQSSVSTDIQNWIGTVSISGAKLAESLKAHLMAYAGDIVTVKEGNLVESVLKSADGFLVKTANESYEAKTVLVATGSQRRKITVPGADKYENKGIVYCASCDGPLFADMDVAVIGGGNAGFETAAQLLAYCKSVTLLHKNNEFKADPVTTKKILSNPKMRPILNAEILEIKGLDFVEKLVYRQKDSDKKVELPVQGIFVEVGSMPATGFVSKLVELDKIGQVIVDPKNQRTSVEGVWAAGDCTNALYHQNNIAAGDAVRALEDIYMYIHTLG
jgi:alkyl hydroperoxide reductase subunit F